MVPYTDNFSNVGITARGIGECVQEPLDFGENDLNTYGESSFLVISRATCPSFCTDISSALGNTSFTDLLMGNSTFDFIDNSSDTSGQQWSSYGSAFVNSDGLSEYSGISGVMSQYSSEGDNTYSESLMYGNDLDLADFDPQDMFLPIPQIQTASPPPSLPPAMLQSTDSELPNLKRLRATVAADLDTANILPIEHRRKRVKPARADEE